MRIHKQFFKSIALTTLLSMGFAVYGIAQDSTSIVDSEAKALTILTTSPSSGEMNVDLGSSIEITFSSDMDEESINGTTLQLHASSSDTMSEMHSEVMLEDETREQSALKDSKNSKKKTTKAVNGTISYSNNVAVFTPNEELKEGTLYTFTVTNGVKNSENIALENKQKWSFTTTGTPAASYTDKKSDKQNDRSYKSGVEKAEEKSKYASSKNKTKAINLGEAGHYVILAKKYVNNESGSKIKGHIGEGTVSNSPEKEKGAKQSPTGQSSVAPSNQNETDSPDPDVNKAIHDMMSAYDDASLQYGDDSTSTTNKSFDSTTVLSPGVYEWSDSLNISSDVTLSGSVDDVWLFKVDKNLSVTENTKFTLADGAKADNVFWYVDGEVTIGKNAQFEGIILSMEDITLEEGAKLNGRMFSQTSITLDDNTVNEPRSMSGQTTSKNE